ncbi:MAG: hypothetical protein IJS59_03800 [Bacteroidaceae bacterium]|nr:hypothetical protein [Bacteroidaceae bacterium]
MMKKNIFASLFIALSLTVGFSSCEDMLTGDMDRHVEIDDIAQDTLYSYWGILQTLQRVAERYVVLGECRGDLVEGTTYVSDSINAILDFGLTGDATDGSNRYLRAADFYRVVNSCNAYIYRCDTSKVSGLNRSLMLSEYAQVVSIRAWAYLQLVLAYNRVPYFETPMLSTADMEDFRSAPQYVDINTLASSGAVKKLEEVCYVPTQLAGDSIRVIRYPNYFYYGNTRLIAYASQCFFPQDLVLGDIYLLRAQGQGSEADYRTAAQHYYNFLNSDKGGPLIPNTLLGSMRKDMNTEEYEYNNNVTVSPSWQSIFRSVAETSQTQEVVTVIPSNTNKLWGEVQRGVNELFGFRATISVNTSTQDTTTTTSASITLTREFERQLVASQAYKQLNKSQNFEAYIGPAGNTRCTVFEGAGDARYYMATSNYTDYSKGSNTEETFVTKQNPGGAFSTTFPVIYRKANIWLHFAQALNGAGFPGYAFAILRNGLIGTEGWVPNDETDYMPATYKYYDKDEIDPETGDTVFYASNLEFIKHIYQRAIEEGTVFEADEETIALYFQGNWDSNTITDEQREQVMAFAEEITAYVNAHPNTFYQKGATFSEIPRVGAAACDYISKREMQAAKRTPFLNFNTIYLRGSESRTSLLLWGGITEYNIMPNETQTNANGPVTMGIHARGCGVLKLGEISSTYNYVDQINKMRRLYAGATEDLTEEEIYDPANLTEVQDAIASLILDEQGLETAFEGTRFFDLVCYSRLIGGTEGLQRVAKRVAERNGSLNSSLYGHLSSSLDNWFFKLP